MCYPVSEPVFIGESLVQKQGQKLFTTEAQRKQRKTIIYVYVVVAQILSVTLQNGFMIDLTVTSEMNDSKHHKGDLGEM